jgi:hypothetical protein
MLETAAHGAQDGSPGPFDHAAYGPLPLSPAEPRTQVPRLASFNRARTRFSQIVTGQRTLLAHPRPEHHVIRSDSGVWCSDTGAAFACARRRVLTAFLTAQSQFPHSDFRPHVEGLLQSSGRTGPMVCPELAAFWSCVLPLTGCARRRPDHAPRHQRNLARVGGEGGRRCQKVLV